MKIERLQATHAVYSHATGNYVRYEDHQQIVDKLQTYKNLFDWIEANIGNIDFNVKVPINIWSTNPWLATGLTFKDALTKARIELAEALK